MAVTSFRDIAGGMNGTDGTRIVEGAGGVVSVHHTGGQVDVFMPTAGGGHASFGDNATVIEPTSVGFSTREIHDPHSAVNYTETSTGYTGTDGSSIVDTAGGTNFYTPDTLEANNIGMDSATSFDLSESVDLPANVNISSIDTSNTDINSLSNMDVSQATPMLDNATNMIDMDGDGIADIVSGVDLDGDGIIDVVSSVEFLDTANQANEASEGISIISDLFDLF